MIARNVLQETSFFIFLVTVRFIGQDGITKQSSARKKKTYRIVLNNNFWKCRCLIYCKSTTVCYMKLQRVTKMVTMYRINFELKICSDLMLFSECERHKQLLVYIHYCIHAYIIDFSFHNMQNPCDLVIDGRKMKTQLLPKKLRGRK